MKLLRKKKDVLLRAAMVLFALAYPLTYLGAGSGSGAFMVVALAPLALGSLLAALL